MNRRARARPARPYFRSSAIGLAVAMLFGCGGGGDGGAVSADPSATVSVNETATMLSVKADLPSSSSRDEYEAQALNYTFAAQIDEGPNKGLAITGRLELKGEREDEGITEVEGRLFPDAMPSDPAGPTRAALIIIKTRPACAPRMPGIRGHTGRGKSCLNCDAKSSDE